MIEHWLSIVSMVLGSGSLLTTLFFWKETKGMKRAETQSQEIANSLQLVQAWKDLCHMSQKRNEALEKENASLQHELQITLDENLVMSATLKQKDMEVCRNFDCLDRVPRSLLTKHHYHHAQSPSEQNESDAAPVPSGEHE